MTSTPVYTCYLFHGDDDLSIEESVNRLRAQMGGDANADLNISEFDGQTASVPEIINAVSSYPFLSDRRLVIVKGLIGWLGRKGAGNAGKQALDQLAEALPNLPDHARLVLAEREQLSDSNKILKAAQSAPRAFVKVFGVPQDMATWIARRARDEHNAQIDNRAALALAAVIGSDLRRADNELFKLAGYVGPERAITEDDVAALTPYVAEANIFKMVDALAEGRGQLALELMHRLLADKDQDPFGLFGMITRQFRLLLLTKEHLAAGGGTNSIAAAIGVRPFQAQSLARQSRAFTVEQLEQIYRALLDSDVKMKTGRMEPDLALDLFVAGITQ